MAETGFQKNIRRNVVSPRTDLNKEYKTFIELKSMFQASVDVLRRALQADKLLISHDGVCHTVPDWSARLRAAEAIINRLLGKAVQPHITIEAPQTNEAVDYSALDADELAALELLRDKAKARAARQVGNVIDENKK